MEGAPRPERAASRWVAVYYATASRIVEMKDDFWEMGAPLALRNCENV